MSCGSRRNISGLTFFFALICLATAGNGYAQRLSEACKKEALARGLVPEGYQVRIHEGANGGSSLRVIVEEKHRGGENYRVWMHSCEESSREGVTMGPARHLFPGTRWENVPEGTFTCLDSLAQKAPQGFWPPGRMRVRSGIAPFQDMVLFFCDTPHRRGEDYRTYLIGCEPVNRYGDYILSDSIELFPKVGSLR